MTDLAINQLPNYTGTISGSDVFPLVQNPGSPGIHLAVKAPFTGLKTYLINSGDFVLTSASNIQSIVSSNNATSVLRLQNDYIEQFIIRSTSLPNQEIAIGTDFTNQVSTIQSRNTGGSTSLLLNPDGGFVGVNYTSGSTIPLPFSVNGGVRIDSGNLIINGGVENIINDGSISSPQFTITSATTPALKTLFYLKSPSSPSAGISAQNTGTGYLDFVFDVNNFSVYNGATSPTLSMQLTETAVNLQKTTNVNALLNVSNTTTITTEGSYVSPHLVMRGTADNTKKLIVGYDVTNNQSFLQSQQGAGPTAQPLLLNPKGGSVGIGYDLGATLPSQFSVNGDGIVEGLFIINKASSGGHLADQLTIQAPSSGSDRIEIGIDSINEAGCIQARTDGMMVYLPLRLQYLGGNTGIGLGSTTAVNATLHSSGTTILGIGNSAIADGNLYNGNINPWVNEGSDILNFKVKYSSGTVKTYNIAFGAGLVTSVFGRTGAVVGVNTDYSAVTNFAARGFSATGVTSTNLVNIKFNEVSNQAAIQSQTAGPVYRDILLNPNGGFVGINYAEGSVVPLALSVNGGFRVDTGNVIVNGGVQTIIKDGTISTPGFRLQGSSNPNLISALYLDTTSKYLGVSSFENTVGYQPIRTDSKYLDIYTGDSSPTQTFRFGQTATTSYKSVVVNERVTATANTVSPFAGWLAGVFGGTSDDKVVIGSLFTDAVVGAHSSDLSAWADLVLGNSFATNTDVLSANLNSYGYLSVIKDSTGTSQFAIKGATNNNLQMVMLLNTSTEFGELATLIQGVGYRKMSLNGGSDGSASVGIGTTAPFAQLHGAHSTILGIAAAQFSSAVLGANQMDFWCDESPGATWNLTFKRKGSDGTTVKTGSIVLS